MTPDRATHRLSAIAGFREEQRRLEGMGLLSLSAEEKKKIRTYHDEVLADLDQSDDTDGESAPYPVHWGMRMAASAGLFVLFGGVFFFLDHIWPDISNLSRAILAVISPLVLFFLSEIVLFMGRSRYFGALLAGLSAFAFAMALLGLTRLFNQPPGPYILIITGGYTTALGVRHRNFALKAIGLFILISGLAVGLSMIGGNRWTIIPERMAIFLGCGLLLYLAGAIKTTILKPIRPAMRLAGLALTGLALIALGLEGYELFFQNIQAYDTAYRIAAAIVFPIAMITGFILGWRETFYGAAALFLLAIMIWLYLWIGAGFPVAIQILSLLALAGAGIWFFSLLHQIMRRRQA